MKIKKTFLLSTILILVASMVINNLSIASAQEETSLEDVLDRGYLIIGTDVDQAPFQSVNPENDKLEGFNVDIANIIADEISKNGVRIEWIYEESDNLITGLNQGSYDCVISTLEINAENGRFADFSRWSYRSEQAILVLSDYPENSLDVESLNSSEFLIGVQDASVCETYTEGNLQQAQISTYPSLTAAIDEINTTIDLVLGNHEEMFNIIRENENDYKIIGTFLNVDYGIAVKEGNTNLLTAINDVLEDLLGTDEEDPDPSDLYNTVYYKWFEMYSTGYTDEVIDEEIPDVGLYRTAAPSFELISIFTLILVVPIVKKKK